MKQLPQHLNIAFFIFKKTTSYNFFKINCDVDYSNHKGITIKAVKLSDVCFLQQSLHRTALIVYKMS